MTKLGSKIFGMTEGIKPRERADSLVPRIKTSPGMFLDTQHRAVKAEAEAAALRNRKVKIADLRIVDGRKRQLSPQEFEELRTNLEAFPLITPITIRTLATGEYELISGHNRVEAYLQLGRDEIDANIIQLEEEQVLPAAFYSNLLSPALPDYEKYLGFKQLQSITGKSQAALAKESGLSKTMISMLFSFDDLAPIVHETLSKNPQLLSATLASKIKGLPFTEHAITLLATGAITTQQVIASATRQPTSTVPAIKSKPVIIKKGKQRFAEVSERGGTVVIKLADVSFVPEFLAEVEALIRRKTLRDADTKNL